MSGSSPIGFKATAATAGGASGADSLQHAKLDVREPPPKGSMKPGGSMGMIDFQFNPKELTVSKSAEWKRDAQKGGKTSAVPQFKGAQPSKLTLEMFLDASEKQDASVVETVEKLFKCCVPTDDTHNKNVGSPPWVVFLWGGLTSFTAYVASVSVKYTLFTPGGLPIRGTATVNLEEIAGVQGGQNPTSGALAARTVHTVVSGDTLASIAWREYGDPNMWRAVAEANGVDDPMRLRAGTALLVPAAEELG